MKFLTLALFSAVVLASCSSDNTESTNEKQKSENKMLPNDTIPVVNMSDTSIKRFNKLTAQQKKDYMFDKVFNKIDYKNFMAPDPRPEADVVAEIRDYDRDLRFRDETRAIWIDMNNMYNLVTTANAVGAGGFRFYLAKDNASHKLTIVIVATNSRNEDYYDPSGNSFFSCQNKGDLCPPPDCILDQLTLLKKARQ